MNVEKTIRADRKLQRLLNVVIAGRTIEMVYLSMSCFHSHNQYQIPEER